MMDDGQYYGQKLGTLAVYTNGVFHYTLGLGFSEFMTFINTITRNAPLTQNFRSEGTWNLDNTEFAIQYGSSHYHHRALQ